MSKKKLNFVIMKSVFGNYWIGKTKLPVNNKTIFTSFDDAISKAISRTDSKENTMDLENTLESDVEEIEKNMEKWIVKS